MNSLVPEGKRFVAVLAYTCQCFLLREHDRATDGSMPEATSLSFPSLRHQQGMSVDRHVEMCDESPSRSWWRCSKSCVDAGPEISAPEALSHVHKL